MSDLFYHITESSELKYKNKDLKQTHLTMFWNFGVGWRHDVNICTVRSMTSRNLISHLCETRKIHKGYITLQTRVVM